MREVRSSQGSTRPAPVGPAPIAGVFLLLSAGCAAPLRQGPPAPSHGVAGVPFTTVVIERLGPEDIWSKAVGDLNGDGRPDLVVGANKSAGGGLVWYENPSWRRHDIDAGQRIGTEVEVADMDADRRPDVVAIRTDNRLSWYRNPDWTPQVISEGTRLHDIEVADFDGDGTLEVVGRNQGAFGTPKGDNLFFFKQRAGGTWSSDSIPIMDGEGLTAADLNGDGRLDLVVNNHWYENTGRFTGEGAWRKHVYTEAWTQAHAFIAVGDINGDGRADIVVSPAEREKQHSRISWFEAPANAGAGPWREHVVEAGAEAIHHFVGLADFDQDAQLDIAAAEMEQGADPDEVKIFLNRGRGAVWHKQVLYTGGSHSMRIFDVDANGTPDLFGGNWRGREVLLWVNNTGSRGTTRAMR